MLSLAQIQVGEVVFAALASSTFTQSTYGQADEHEEALFRPSFIFVSPSIVRVRIHIRCSSRSCSLELVRRGMLELRQSGPLSTTLDRHTGCLSSDS